MFRITFLFHLIIFVNLFLPIFPFWTVSDRLVFFIMINRFLICLLSHLFRIYLSNLISLGRFALFLSVSSAAVLDRSFGSYIGEDIGRELALAKTNCQLKSEESWRWQKQIANWQNWLDFGTNGEKFQSRKSLSYIPRYFCDFPWPYFTVVVPRLPGFGTNLVYMTISMIGNVF